MQNTRVANIQVPGAAMNVGTEGALLGQAFAAGFRGSVAGLGVSVAPAGGTGGHGGGNVITFHTTIQAPTGSAPEIKKLVDGVMREHAAKLTRSLRAGSTYR